MNAASKLEDAVERNPWSCGGQPVLSWHTPREQLETAPPGRYPRGRDAIARARRYGDQLRLPASSATS
jgi:hypothetical protein